MATANPVDDDEAEYEADTYKSDLLENLHTFYQQGLFTDVDVIVGKEKFQVHRAVLASCSDYFKAMFSHGMKESTATQLEVTTVSATSFKQLLQFAYTAKLTLRMGSIREILAAATYLQMTAVIKLCSTFLQSRMSFENAESIIDTGAEFGLEELKLHHKKLVLKNFKEFTKTAAFFNLDHKQLEEYLIQDSLCDGYIREDELLKLTLTWYKHSEEERAPVIHHVLDKIRFQHGGWPLISWSEAREPFQSNPKCAKLLTYAEEFMRNTTRMHLKHNHRTRVRFPRKTLVIMGGIKLCQQQAPYFGYELPGDDDIMSSVEEKVGNTQSFYYHDTQHDWSPAGAVAIWDSRSHCPMVQVNDFGLLVGGYLYISDVNHGNSNIQHCSNEVKLLCPGSAFALWDMTYMRQARASHVVCATQSYVYAIGGRSEAGVLRTVERLDLEEVVWYQLPSLDTPVYDHAGTSVGRQVYISGGIDATVQTMNACFCYDENEECWSESPPMLVCRAGHTMEHLNNRLIVCGGRTLPNSTRCLASVESFDIETHQWTFIKSMRADCAYMTSVVLNDKLLLVGGENSVGDLQSKITEYDPEKDTWDTFCHLPFPLKNMGCCALTVPQAPGPGVADTLTDTLDGDLVDESDQEEYDDCYLSDHDGEDSPIEDWRSLVRHVKHNIFM